MDSSVDLIMDGDVAGCAASSAAPGGSKALEEEARLVAG